jgi:oxygen-independent coproporphyrinogen-3 oxidase
MTETTKTEVGSYFISNYPPFSQWTEQALPEIQAALNQAPQAKTPLGLYLHIPFCRKRCKFCYFKVFTDQNAKDIEAYVSALSREIELVADLPVMGGRPFRFVYFGGGTPSFLSVRQLTSLVDRLRANISWDQAEEVTFECEPGTLQENKVRTLKELGVTRLSLGVENFSDSVLEENGRAHLAKEVYQAWDWIQSTGFHNVNIDLISGMVGETWDNWKYNIKEALKFSPDSVTIYQMELPFNTVYSQDILGNRIETPVADWETKRAWLDYAFDQFLAAGYKISSAYTLVKDNDKVNFSYRDNLWQGSDLLATGIASFGHVSGVHYQNKADMKSYQGDLMTPGQQSKLPLGRALRPTPHQLLVREMILLLKRGFLQVNYFQQKFGVNILDEWKQEFDQHQANGMLVVDGSRIELTRKGFLHADALLPVFFEPEHRGIRYT